MQGKDGWDFGTDTHSTKQGHAKCSCMHIDIYIYIYTYICQES